MVSQQNGRARCLFRQFFFCVRKLLGKHVPPTFFLFPQAFFLKIFPRHLSCRENGDSSSALKQLVFCYLQNCPITYYKNKPDATVGLMWQSPPFFFLHALEKQMEMSMMIKSSEVDSQHLLSLYNVSSKLSASESLSVSEELTPMDH